MQNRNSYLCSLLCEPYISTGIPVYIAPLCVIAHPVNDIRLIRNASRTPKFWIVLKSNDEDTKNIT